MPSGYYQVQKHPGFCRHPLPLVYQFCDRCHIGYPCCTTCMHLHRCETCMQQAFSKAGSGEGRHEGGLSRGNEAAEAAHRNAASAVVGTSHHNRDTEYSMPRTRSTPSVVPCPPADWLLPGGTRPGCCARHQHQYDGTQAAVRMVAPCVLCGGPQAVRGLFLPYDPVRWGGNASQHRLLLYSLCLECLASPESDTAVEQRLYAAMRHAGRLP